VGKLDLILAERRGSQTAEKFGFSAFPIDPRQLAAKRGISVEAKPLKDCYGCLLRQGDHFGIAYSSSLANEGMINFTIGHELGHYFLDGHAEALFPGGAGLHQSLGPFKSIDPREREADHFAVGLLLPEPLFVKELRRLDQGLAAVRALSELCQTSFTATAIRYATLAEDPVAIVVATNGVVDFCFLSTPLKEHRGLVWLSKGSKIPKGTPTAKLATDSTAVEKGQELGQECSFSDWFEGGPETDCAEEVVGLGRFGQTLTVLWSDQALDSDDDDEDEDDDDW